jgi:sec-independent protein translocase protein TatA
MLAMLEGQEWLIIGALALLLFGGAQLPKLARSLGQAQKEFKNGLADGAADDAPADGKAEANADTPA